MGRVSFQPHAVRGLRRLKRMDPKAAAALLAKADEYAADPTASYAWARPLTGRPGLRLRQGDYRALIEIDHGPPVVISVMNVGHRKDVYL